MKKHSNTFLCLTALCPHLLAPGFSQVDDWGNQNNKVWVDAQTGFSSGANYHLAKTTQEQDEETVTSLGVQVGVGANKALPADCTPTPSSEEENTQSVPVMRVTIGRCQSQVIIDEVRSKEEQKLEAEKREAEGRKRREEAEVEAAKAAKHAVAAAKLAEQARAMELEAAEARLKAEEERRRADAKRMEEERKLKVEEKKHEAEMERKTKVQEEIRKKREKAEADARAKLEKKEDKNAAGTKANVDKAAAAANKEGNSDVPVQVVDLASAEIERANSSDRPGIGVTAKDAQDAMAEIDAKYEANKDGEEQEAYQPNSELDTPTVEWAKRAVDRAVTASSSVMDNVRQGGEPNGENPAIAAAAAAVRRLQSFADMTTNEEEKATARAAAKRVGEAAAKTKAALMSVSEVEKLTTQAENQRKAWVEKGQETRDYEKMHAAINMISTGNKARKGDKGAIEETKKMAMGLLTGPVLGWTMAKFGAVLGPVGQAIGGAAKGAGANVGPLGQKVISSVGALGGPAGEAIVGGIFKGLETIEGVVPNGTAVKAASGGFIGAWALASAAKLVAGPRAAAEAAKTKANSLIQPSKSAPPRSKAQTKGGGDVKSKARAPAKNAAKAKGSSAAKAPWFKEVVVPEDAANMVQPLAAAAGVGLAAAAVAQGGGLSALRGLLGRSSHPDWVEVIVNGRDAKFASWRGVGEVMEELGVTRRCFVESGGRTRIKAGPKSWGNATLASVSCAGDPVTLGSMDMTVFVRGEDKTMIRMLVARDTKISELMVRMRMPLQIGLSHRGEQLKGSKTLKGSGIVEGDVLTLCERKANENVLDSVLGFIAAVPGGQGIVQGVTGVVGGVVGAAKNVGFGVIQAVLSGKPINEALGEAAGSMQATVGSAAMQVMGIVKDSNASEVAKAMAGQAGGKVLGSLQSYREKGAMAMGAAAGVAATAAGKNLTSVIEGAGHVLGSANRVAEGAMESAGKWISEDGNRNAVAAIGAALPAMWMFALVVASRNPGDGEGGGGVGGAGKPLPSRGAPGTASAGKKGDSIQFPDGVPLGGLFEAMTGNKGGDGSSSSNGGSLLRKSPRGSGGYAWIGADLPAIVPLNIDVGAVFDGVLDLATSLQIS